MRSQCNFQWTIKHRIPSNSRDWKKKKKNRFLLPPWVSRIFSLAIEPFAGAVRHQPTFSLCCFLPPSQGFYSCIQGGRGWVFRLVESNGGFTQLYCRIWTEARRRGFSVTSAAPPPLCCTVLKTSGEDCFKTRAGILRHIAEMSGFQCYCCEEALPVRKVISPRCCHSWWRDCNLTERAMMSNSRLPLFGLCFIDIRLG